MNENRRGSAGVLSVLVLAFAVGGFGYCFGYANGEKRAVQRADERLDHMWLFLPAGDGVAGPVDDADETPGQSLPAEPAAPAPQEPGVADPSSHASADG